jgi:putative transposase
MRSNFTQLYLHCVWATWDRLPLITPDIKELVYAAIIRGCSDLKCTTIALGGIEDHIHLLVGIPATLSVSDLVKAVKGSSSHFITHEIKPDSFFKWQGSYGAFTVSDTEIDKVANYIRNQVAHHQQKSLIPNWEFNG